nr:hypothetical protein [Tanacetum cinerariifolium]
MLADVDNVHGMAHVLSIDNIDHLCIHGSMLLIYCAYALFTGVWILAGQPHLDCGCSHAVCVPFNFVESGRTAGSKNWSPRQPPQAHTGHGLTQGRKIKQALNNVHHWIWIWNGKIVKKPVNRSDCGQLQQPQAGYHQQYTSQKEPANRSGVLDLKHPLNDALSEMCIAGGGQPVVAAAAHNQICLQALSTMNIVAQVMVAADEHKHVLLAK